MKISFVGDTLLPSAPVKIDSTINRLLSTSKFVFANLETPIKIKQSDESPNRINRILGNFPISSKLADLKFLPDFNYVWGTSNNHIADFGSQGVEETFFNISSNNKHAYFKFDNVTDCLFNVQTSRKRILVYSVNFTNPKFGFIELNIYNNKFKKGPFGLQQVLKALEQIKIDEFDAIIGFVHLGRCGYSRLFYEDYDKILKIRSVIPKSIPHIVFGHHAHQAGEVIEDKKNNQLIISSLGNFIFKEKWGRFSDNYYFNWLVCVDIKEKIAVKVYPLHCSDSKIRMANKDELHNFPDYKSEYVFD